MSVAIRAITRVQDADDFGSTPGAGNDGYALTWDNDAGEFVLAAAGVTDHGALTGLSDDDHTGYALLAGRSGGQTLYGGTAANDDITIHGTSDVTRTTSYVLLQPTAGNVGIGTTSPSKTVEIQAPALAGVCLRLSEAGTTGYIELGDGAAIAGRYWPLIRNSVVGNQFSQAAIQTVIAASDDAGSTPVFVFDGRRSGAAIVTRPLFAVTNYGGTALVQISASGSVGIGTILPATLLHGLLTSAVTNAVTNVVTIGHDTSGTAAAGFGAGLAFQLESSTTAAQNAARIRALWYEATHATFKGDLVGTAFDAGGEREGWRVRGAGSAAAIGFYGVSPVERATLATGAGASVDDVITALQNLGLVKQS